MDCRVLKRQGCLLNQVRHRLTLFAGKVVAPRRLGTIYPWGTYSPCLRCLLPWVVLQSRRDARQTALVEKLHNEKTASRSDPLAPGHTTSLQEIGHRRRTDRF